MDLAENADGRTLMPAAARACKVALSRIRRNHYGAAHARGGAEIAGNIWGHLITGAAGWHGRRGGLEESRKTDIPPNVRLGFVNTLSSKFRRSSYRRMVVARV